MRLRTLCGLFLVAAGVASAAEPPAPAGIPDLVGPRALGLSAAIGIASGNEGLYLNPAAAGARKRYSVEAMMLTDRRGAETDAQFFGGSVMDSLSGPVAGGVSYVRAQRGASTGSLWHVSVGGALAQDFYVGVAAKYLSLDTVSLGRTNAVTADAGLFWQVADVFSIGAAGYNLVSIANAAVAPMGAGVGVGIGNDRSVQVTADWRGDFDRLGKTANRYGAGVETLLGNLVPIRAGWSKDDVLGTKWWSVGAGLITQTGVALDFGYRQSIDDKNARTLAASLRLFLFQ